MSILEVDQITAVDRAIYLRLFDAVEKPSGSVFYDLLGHQPDKKVLGKLDEEIPLIWIQRKGGGEASDVGSTPQTIYRPATFDSNDPPNPLTYDAFEGSSIVDLTYEIRYIAFHEDDERAMSAQLRSLFPTHGIALYGPNDEGPFWCEVSLFTDVPGLRPKEIGGILRVIVRHVSIGGRPVETAVPAITSVEFDIEAVPEIK